MKNHIPVIIVTGLSGAGKSTALHVLEDLNFFCVDGLPASMVTKLVSLFLQENPRGYRGLALGMDIRQADFLKEWKETLGWLHKKGIQPQVIFFKANNEVLIRRYATTRRPHPLESSNIGLEQALENERSLLEQMQQDADLVVDTSEFSIHDLRRFLQKKWEDWESSGHGLRVHLISFGYKYGVPTEADLVFDLRFLPNPFFDQELKPLSGQDEKVARYIFKDEPGCSFIERFWDFLDYLLPLYAREGRYRLTVALGCTGGRHRSVAVTEKIYSLLQNYGYEASLEHRHLELG